MDRVRDDEQAGRGAAAELLRTKASDLKSFLAVAELKANSSNNTLFADNKGEIAYLHPQFVPVATIASTIRSRSTAAIRRQTGSGRYTLDELPNVVNPPNGWVQNTNAWPYRAAGANSPNQRTSLSTWTRTARISAGSTPSRC